MSRKKKSKKRKNSIIKDVDCDSPAAEKETENEISSPQTKKQKLTKASTSCQDVTNDEKRRDPTEVTSDLKEKNLKHKKKDKKKKKKKKKKKSKSKDDLSQALSTDAAYDGDVRNPSQVTLEGIMVDDQMVLVDRPNRKVYSMNDRYDNGEYIQIGSVGNYGKIILDNANKNPSDSSPAKEQQQQPDFPFEIDPDDHCESPLIAYQDISPFLTSCNKGKQALQIYDPYYCNGNVANHLKSLGFPKVYNQKEDCYQVWADPSRYPVYDILVTNPPYSGDHIEKLMRHITLPAFGNRPWMLLLPQWVHKKDYYVKHIKHIRPFYVVPHKRYVYEPPPDFREKKKSDVHKKSSPFVSMWFIWGGTMQQNERWISRVARSVSSCDVARSKSALRDLRRKGSNKK